MIVLGTVRGFYHLFIVVAVLCLSVNIAFGANVGKQFSRTSVDIGIVVRSIEESLKFYEQALGARKGESFTMSSAMVQKLGLADGTSMKVQVVSLGEKNQATKIKLIELPGQPVKPLDAGAQPVSTSHLGIRYITIFVTNLDKLIAKLNKIKKKPIFGGPMCLGEKDSQEVCLLTVHDPDGNLIELVGPKVKTD